MVTNMDAKEIERILDELQEESDRSAVILGTAMLDKLLFQLLEKFLLPSKESKDDLLGGEGALSDFSARIKISYRLGLIDSELQRSLNFIKKLRNHFAHKPTGCSFDISPYRDWAKELEVPFEEYPEYQEAKTGILGDKVSSPSAGFRIVIAIIGARIEDAIRSLEPIQKPKPLGLIPNVWIEGKAKQMFDSKKGGDE